jgi:hypothetical protein
MKTNDKYCNEPNDEFVNIRMVELDFWVYICFCILIVDQDMMGMLLLNEVIMLATGAKFVSAEWWVLNVDWWVLNVKIESNWE